MLMPMWVTPEGLNTPELVEELYKKMKRAHQSGANGKIALDLSHVKFIFPDGLLALATFARLWHQWTGHRTMLGHMQPEVHRYLDRMDLFKVCDEWLYPDPHLVLNSPYDRSHASFRLLEVIPISGDEQQNSSDVIHALTRAQQILDAWFPTDELAIGPICNILSEIATNVVHSGDRGLAVIQRYNDLSAGPHGSRVTIAIADLGIGIEASLRAKSRPHGPVRAKASWLGSDYIYYALREGISSPNRLRGTGLPIINTIVKQWSGSLAIRSFGSLVRFNPVQTDKLDNLVKIPGTQVTITIRGTWGPDKAF